MKIRRYICPESAALAKEIVSLMGEADPSVIPTGIVDVPAGRQKLEAAGEMAFLLPDIRVDRLEIGGMESEILTPEQYSDRIVLFIHGGAYLFGSLNTHRVLASSVARAAKAKALIPAYSLAPERPFPVAVYDVVSAYNWLLQQGYDPEQITVAGDSAGGGLAIASMLVMKGKGIPLPGAAVCLSPWVNLAATCDDLRARIKKSDITGSDLYYKAKIYSNGEDLLNPLISPVYGDLREFPPMLIQAGGNETLLEDAVLLEERAAECGVDVTLEIWEGMYHVFQSGDAWLEESKTAINIIGEFIQTHTF